LSTLISKLAIAMACAHTIIGPTTFFNTCILKPRACNREVQQRPAIPAPMIATDNLEF